MPRDSFSSTTARGLGATLEFYFQALKVLLALLMASMVVPVSLQVLARFSGFVPRYIWTEEMARFCFVWIIMIGSMIAVRDETHFRVDLLPKAETERGQGFSDLIVHLAMIALALVFVWYGYGFAKSGFAQTSEMSGINMLSIYISFPLAGLTWVLFLLERIAADIRLISSNSQEPKS
ncbi:MAG: TRAP-type C4-dicarboxylate transport system permease small subunit [Pirellulaceae bacterium]